MTQTQTHQIADLLYHRNESKVDQITSHHSHLSSLSHPSTSPVFPLSIPLSFLFVPLSLLFIPLCPFPAAGARVFPPSDTRLAPASLTEASAGASAVSGSSSGDGSSSDELVATSGDFTFVSQSFFMCWRGLHLGIVTAINELRIHCLRTGNYMQNLESANPQAVSTGNYGMASRFSLSAILVNKPLLQDLVTFCEAASYSLLGALCGYDALDDATHATTSGSTFTGQGQQGLGQGSSSSLDGAWLVAPSDCPPSQLALIASLPEHFVDDIMSILLFVSKTDPSVLSHRCVVVVVVVVVVG